MILVVGKHSYLAQEFLTQNRMLPIRAIGYAEVGNLAQFEDIDCIVNFAFAPQLHNQPYDRALDIDAELGRYAAERNIHYVMLSSRKVYQASLEWDAVETANVLGLDEYGRNKVRIEKILSDLLGDRLTILRPGNVFGYEVMPGRTRFGAYLLNQLAAEGNIHMSLSPFIKRDIVPVDFFVEVLRTVVLKKPSGIFNVGAGEAVEIGRIALWLLDGFGSGALLVDGHADGDQFQLDSRKLQDLLDLYCGRERVEVFTKGIGERLARELGHAA